MGVGGGARLGLAAVAGGLGEGQPHAEDGVAGSTVERQRAVVALDDDAPRGGEAEAGAVPDVLGREERVEDPRGELVGNAGAVVGDLDDRAVAVGARGDRDRAALAERVDRVVEQVRPDLVELGAVHGELGQDRS